jgi:hypothetical protein
MLIPRDIRQRPGVPVRHGAGSANMGTDRSAAATTAAGARPADARAQREPWPRPAAAAARGQAGRRGVARWWRRVRSVLQSTEPGSCARCGLAA